MDTISHDKFAKTIINKDAPKTSDDNLTEEEKAEKYVIDKKFLSQNLIKASTF